jgi:hypothetical protein
LRFENALHIAGYFTWGHEDAQVPHPRVRARVNCEVIKTVVTSQPDDG